MKDSWPAGTDWTVRLPMINQRQGNGQTKKVVSAPSTAVSVTQYQK